MPARRLLNVIYTLLIEGADSEGIEKLDNELNSARVEEDQGEKLAAIYSLGGVVMR